MKEDVLPDEEITLQDSLRFLKAKIKLLELVVEKKRRELEIPKRELEHLSLIAIAIELSLKQNQSSNRKVSK